MAVAVLEDDHDFYEYCIGRIILALGWGLRRILIVDTIKSFASSRAALVIQCLLFAC
jgi:hypothetical protein